MGIVDNIIGAVILLSIVVLTTLIIALSANNDMLADLEFKRMSHLSEKHQLSLNTIMSITEPSSGQSYARLLSRSLSNRDDIVHIGAREYNVTERINKALDTVYGPDNWYYEVYPRITDLGIAFVMDGTTSLEPERHVIEENLEYIIRSVNDSISTLPVVPDISFKVYITSEDISKCEQFNNMIIEGFLGCVNIEHDEMYVSYNGLDYPRPSFDTITDVGNNHYNELVSYIADWMGGVVYGTNDLLHSFSDPSDSMILVFPISDELTTGSIPDECYSSGEPLYSAMPGDSPENIAERVSINAAVCAYCHSDCPTERSNRQIDSGTQIINDLISDLSYYSISGIYSEDCETIYQDYYNHVPDDPAFQYINDRFTSSRPYPDYDNWCQMSECTGCSSNHDDPRLICWRSVCSDDTEEQLRLLSEDYAGSLINLLHLDDLPRVIVDSISDSLHEQARIGGVLREDAERYVVTYDIIIAGNIIMPFSVWVYEDRVFDDSLPELISIEADPNMIFSGQETTIRIAASDSNGISTIRIVIDGTEYTLSPTNGYYEYRINTEGFEEGSYDVEYRIVNILGNRLEGIEADILTVDNTLAPVPQDVVLDLNEVYVIDRIASPIAQFDSDINVEIVRIIVRDDNGNVFIEQDMIPASITGSSYEYFSTYNVGSNTGDYSASLHIIDSLGRIFEYDDISFYEVTDLIECDTNNDCTITGMDYCVGDTKDDYYCYADKARDGWYTYHRDNCQEGLAHDIISMECFNPDASQYNIVFLPDGYHNTAQYEHFVRISIDRLKDETPLKECNPSIYDDRVRFLVGRDPNCLENLCTPNILIGTEHEVSIKTTNCINRMTSCAQAEFGPVATDVHALSPTTYGSVYGFVPQIGKRRSLTSKAFISDEDNTALFLHEAGHSWGLWHIDSPPPPNHPGGACGILPDKIVITPNAADCDLPLSQKRLFIMGYNIPNKPLIFGPAAYEHLKTNITHGFGGVMGDCE